MNKHLKIGPGGRNCPCCFPAKGSNDRRKQFRRAKKKAERIAMREAVDEINEEYEFNLELQRDLEYYHEEEMEDNWEYYTEDDEPDDLEYDSYDYSPYADECWHCGRLGVFCQCDGN